MVGEVPVWWEKYFKEQYVCIGFETIIYVVGKVPMWLGEEYVVGKWPVLFGLLPVVRMGRGLWSDACM